MTRRSRYKYIEQKTKPVNVSLICSNNRNQEMPDFTSLVYIKPYCRIGPYLVGMGLGYLMHLQRSSARRPHWVSTISVALQKARTGAGSLKAD